MAVTLQFSIRELLRRLASEDGEPVSLVDSLHEQVREKLDTPLILNHARFTGPMEVRSLRDLDVVVAAWRLHQAEAGPPPHLVIINISRVNICSDAGALCKQVNDGVTERGWIVHGLDSLTAAEELDARLVTLRAGLTRLTSVDGMTPLGDILDPEVLEDMDKEVKKIDVLISSIDGGRVVSPEAVLVIIGVDELIKKARSDERDYSVWDDAMSLIRKLDAARSDEVSFF